MISVFYQAYENKFTLGTYKKKSTFPYRKRQINEKKLLIHVSTIYLLSVLSGNFLDRE